MPSSTSEADPPEEPPPSEWAEQRYTGYTLRVRTARTQSRRPAQPQLSNAPAQQRGAAAPNLPQPEPGPADEESPA